MLTDSIANDLPIEIPPGDYQVMVWADLMNEADGDSYYNADNFAEIRIQLPYKGNTDYRDAFCGTSAIKMSDFYNRENDIVTIVEMSRPLAKYEFVSSDLKEFLAQEIEQQAQKRAKAVQKAGYETLEETEGTRVGEVLNRYHVKFFYEGYLPITYSMLTDKPVDAITGIGYEGSFTVLSEDEVSLGFDYVFVNHKETTISVRIGLFNQEGELISLTQPIDVPLKRSTHTLVKGRYLMEKSSSSVTIDPSYEDDYNIIF